MAKVLLADDEVTMVQMVTEVLRAEGHEVFPFTNGSAALEAIEAIVPELVITDLYLDKTRPQGFDILHKARSLNPPGVVIVITAFGSIETAVEAMKSGAYDYLEKPFKLDELNLCIQRALSYNEAISENLYLRKQLKKKYQFSQIIGTAPKMQGVFKMIERVWENIPTYINVRVLAATNEPLEKRIKEGSFREDLYYRLNVIAITLPSLRERRDDIPLLVSHFLKNKINPRNGQPVQITRQTME